MTVDPHPRACIMGHNVAYSRSPFLHGYWLRTLQLPGSYGLVDVAPEDFPRLLRDLAGHGYVGGNVTKPHKTAAFRLVDHRDPAADAVGAVNTVWYEGALLMGGNTDVHGYLASLDDQAPGWDASAGIAVVIGAGGAASSAIYGLLGRGLRVAVVNRTLAHADALVRRFGPQVSAHGWTDLSRLLADAVLLTNTTVLGASGQPSLDIDISPLDRRAVVCDIVYVPLVTALLKVAEQRGHRIADGLGMLMHQAVPAFARWFGATPTVTPQLRRLLEADIRAST
ncbi:MAG: shikimate dehydrogenase [Xanthobacteraceae bacterium]